MIKLHISADISRRDNNPHLVFFNIRAVTSFNYHVSCWICHGSSLKTSLNFFVFPSSISHVTRSHDAFPSTEFWWALSRATKAQCRYRCVFSAQLQTVVIKVVAVVFFPSLFLHFHSFFTHFNISFKYGAPWYKKEIKKQQLISGYTRTYMYKTPMNVYYSRW